MGAFNAEEAFDLFWDEYDKVLTGNSTAGKGVRTKALTSWKRKITSAKKAGYVLSRFRMQRDEWIRKSKNTDDFQANFPHVSTYINQERWETEVDQPESGYKPKTQLGQCSYPKCNNTVMGPLLSECEIHLNPSKRNEEKSQLIEWMKTNGLMKLKSESADEWRARMRQAARDKFKEMLGNKVRNI